MVILTEADLRQKIETETQRMRAMLAAMLFRAQTLGAQTIDLKGDRDPVLIARAESATVAFSSDPPHHLVPRLIAFMRSGFGENEQSLDETLVTEGRDGVVNWKFWYDGADGLHFARTTPASPPA